MNFNVDFVWNLCYNYDELIQVNAKFKEVIL